MRGAGSWSAGRGTRGHAAVDGRWRAARHDLTPAPPLSCPSLILAHGAVASWPHSLPGRGWRWEREGAGEVWRCPVLGLGLDGQRHPAPTRPLETPRFPWKDPHRVIFREGSSLFPLKSQLPRLGGGRATVPGEGMQHGGKGGRAQPASLRGCRHPPSPTLPHCPTVLCPRAGQGRDDVGLCRAAR